MFRVATAHGGWFALEVAQCASLRYQRCVPLLWAWLLITCITIGCTFSCKEYRCFLTQPVPVCHLSMAMTTSCLFCLRITVAIYIEHINKDVNVLPSINRAPSMTAWNSGKIASHATNSVLHDANAKSGCYMVDREKDQYAINIQSIANAYSKLHILR